MKLSGEMKQAFQAELIADDEERQVKYVISIERFGIRKGILVEKR